MSDFSPDEDRSFNERLAQAQKRFGSSGKSHKIGQNAGETNSAFSMAIRIASDMVAGIAVGAAIGYGLDYWTGQRVLFLIIFVLLGFCAGMRNVWRIVNTPMQGNGDKKDRSDLRGGRTED